MPRISHSFFFFCDHIVTLIPVVSMRGNVEICLIFQTSVCRYWNTRFEAIETYVCLSVFYKTEVA
jgi:hypothetical protein